MQEDLVLVQRAIASPDDFGAIVEKYERKIDSYIQSILRLTKEDREDILQEIFIAVYRNLNSYNSEYSFSTWLYRIAHNQTITFLRKNNSKFKHEKLQGNQVTQESESEDDAAQFENIASDEDIEANVEQLLQLKLVKERMRQLPLQDREILQLRYCEQQEYSQIESILRIPEGTVASLIHRAKAKLKKVLHERPE